jgi:predicted transcriptional regulator
VVDEEALASIATSLDRLSRVAVLRLIRGRERDEQAWLLDHLGYKQAEIGDILHLTQSAVSKAITRYKKQRPDAAD